MSGRTGRPRDVGDERFATVTEASEALGVTYQAVRNRMKAGTVPYEEHVIEGRASYRIPRAWLNQEVSRKESHATKADTAEIDLMMGQRTAEVFKNRFAEGFEVIRHEVEVQHTQVVPLLQKTLENQKRVLGNLSEITTNQAELYKQIREATARAEEANRRAEEADQREREYQKSNLELAAENHQLQREMLEASKETAEMLRLARADADRQREEREGAGEPERRSWWRRLFDS